MFAYIALCKDCYLLTGAAVDNNRNAREAARMAYASIRDRDVIERIKVTPEYQLPAWCLCEKNQLHHSRDFARRISM